MGNRDSSITRRKFLSSAAAAGALIPLSGYEGILSNTFHAAEARSVHFFTKALQWLSYEEMAELVAEAGAEGIDLPVRPGGHVLPENVTTDLPRAYAAAKKNGLRMDMMVTGILSVDDKNTEPILRTAASLGIKYYRLGWLGYDDSLGVMGTLQKFRAELKKLEQMNRKYQLHGAYQNHVGNRIGGAVWDLYEVVKDLDPEFIGVQYDVRHAVAEGGQSWVNGFKLVMPWIRCTDIKDFVWRETNGKWAPESIPLGTGIVPLDDYFKMVQKNNLPGPMSLHIEYPPLERFTGKVTDAEKKKLFVDAIRRDVDKLKSYRTKYQL